MATTLLQLPLDALSQYLSDWDLLKSRAVCRGLRDALVPTQRGCRALLYQAAASGSTDLLHRLDVNGQLAGAGWSGAWGVDLCCMVISNNRLDVLQWLHARGCPIAPEACAAAARYGDVNVFRWCAEVCGAWNPEWSLVAARYGHEALIRWMHYAQRPISLRICETAAQQGLFDVMKWAIRLRYARPESGPLLCQWAARDGRVDILLWLVDRGCHWDEATCEFAAGSGHLQTLQCARGMGCPWDGRAPAAAARGGHLTVLQWIWSQADRPRWDEELFAEAATGGDRRVMRWLQSRCPWDSRAFAEAAGNADLDTVTWLFEQNCPWDESVFRAAMHSEQRFVIEWLRSRGCPEPPPGEFDEWGHFL